ncbi:MAG: SDR family NAD(P)-dependent oxidoreductase [Gammaproteobacteria bacterium]|nr:SDR family NAD(P)-dependent oxidoreductase [Gammaproteobacteria bacterium]
MSASPQTTFGGRTTAEEVLAGIKLQGQTIIVTGANTGIGEAAAQALAGTGAHIIFACRDVAAGRAAVERTKAVYPRASADVSELDLASFTSTQAFVARLDTPRVDTLICNAGLSLTRYAATAEGFERTVGISHIGHLLLTRLMMHKLLAASAPRLVMVSSHSHRMPKTLDFNRFPMTPQNFNGLVAYGQAKLCNIFMARSLQKRYGDRGLMACALHPGTLITTEIGRHSGFVNGLIQLIRPFTKSRSQGAATTVWAATHQPAADLAAQYLSDCKVVESSAEARDAAIAERVWVLSNQWLEQKVDLSPWP